MKIKLTLCSPLSSHPLKLIWPLAPSFMINNPTICDLVYSVFKTFPWFFAPPVDGEASGPEDGGAGAAAKRFEDFSEDMFACENRDGWKFCFWHLVQDVLEDGDMVTIRKMENEQQWMRHQAYSTLARLPAETPRLDDAIHRTPQISMALPPKRPSSFVDVETPSMKRPKVAPAPAPAPSVSFNPPDETESSKLDVTLETKDDGPDEISSKYPPPRAPAVPRKAGPDSSPIKTYTAPYQGTVATRSRNARRRRSKEKRRQLDVSVDTSLTEDDVGREEDRRLRARRDRAVQADAHERQDLRALHHRLALRHCGRGPRPPGQRCGRCWPGLDAERAAGARAVAPARAQEVRQARQPHLGPVRDRADRG
ncbi:uncharacterized protein V1510DRAFT_229325 [Dipodascopsis tothii]|uniref:uncharacterized protein n=1 Tax=Dipodascopsis tothii TaxID=44089 RepID=UPI0034CD5BD5